MTEIEIFDVIEMALVEIEKFTVLDDMGKVIMENQKWPITVDTFHKDSGTVRCMLSKILAIDDTKENTVIRLLGEIVPDFSGLDEIAQDWFTTLINSEIDEMVGTMDNERLALKGCSNPDDYAMTFDNLERMKMYTKFLRGLADKLKTDTNNKGVVRYV